MQVEQWGIFEAALQGPDDGNPFVDVACSAVFRQGQQQVEVSGFYDGQGIYRIRFMPDRVGEWRYETRSNRAELAGKTGEFTVHAPSVSNHGPVQVRDTYHFAYADGTPYRQVGTTCYAWTHQNAALQQQTLQTLAASPFNKLRMCIFPKWFEYNRNEPTLYPFEGTPPKQWDFSRFNPAFFQHLDQQIARLRDLGIEADLILFHPYDHDRWGLDHTNPYDIHWGFDRMGQENDDRYLRYVIARFAAYHNLWWSLANEWDFVDPKHEADWERFGRIVQQNDPYRHLCSIHNGAQLFDQTRPWITHVSLQYDRPDEAQIYRDRYKKPLIYDECRYEGNIPEGWGDITAERLVGMFWKTLVGGAYCGHGETYLDANDELWWSKGGVLHGKSPARIAFLKQIIDEAPAAAGEPLKQQDAWGVEGAYYLIYLWDRQPAQRIIDLPTDTRFTADVIDTWEMTITALPGTFSGRAEIPLPTKPYQAIRLLKE